MAYLEELLAGYRRGLAGKPSQPIQSLRAALAETDDAWQRGRLLGLIAQRLAERVGSHSITYETPSLGQSITSPGLNVGSYGRDTITVGRVLRRFGGNDPQSLDRRASDG